MNILSIPDGWKYAGKVQGKDAFKRFDGMAIIYSLDQMEDGSREHHVSISYRQYLPTNRHINQVVSDWGLDSWERDDQGGRLAHLWLKDSGEAK